MPHLSVQARKGVGIRYPVLIAVSALVACEPESRFAEAISLQEVMLHVVEPAAEVYWDSVGTVLDAEGTHEIAPANVNEWIAVENAAATIAESGNLLLLPGRDRDDPRWTELAQALTESGRIALAAADSRDTDAVFDAGGDIYMACANCHAVFAPVLLPPNFEPER